MAEQNRVEIRVTASGAEQAAKILQDVAKSGGQLGSVTAAGAKQAEAAMGGLGKSVQGLAGLMGQAGVNTGILGQAIGALTSPLGVAAAGFVALGLAINHTTTFMQENYKQLRQLQAVSGLSADAADQLADTFDLLGLNSEALSAAMFKMSQEIDTGGASLRALGVNIRDAGGALKEPGQLFLEVRDKIAGLGSAAEKNAVIMQAFGRQGRELAAVFALSADEFDKYMQKAGMMGPSAEESMRVTKEYTLAQAELNKVIQGFTETVGIRLLPVLTDITRGLLASIEATSQWGATTTSWLDRVAVKWENLKRSGYGAIGITLPAPDMSAAMAAAGDSGAGATKTGGTTRAVAEIKAVTDELKKMADQVEVMRASQLDQPIVKLEQAFRAFAEKAGPAATAQMRAFVDELIGLERAKQAEAAMKALGAAMGGLATTLTAVAVANDLFAESMTDEQKTLQTVVTALDQARAKLVELKDALPPAELAARLKAFDDGAKAIRDWVTEVTKGKTALEEAKKFYADLAEKTMDAAKSFETLQFNYENWLATLTKDDALEEAKAFYANLKTNIETAAGAVTSTKQPFDDAARSGLAFQDSLAAIGREAALLGPDFDEASAQLNLFKSRILELQAIKNPTGEILTEIDQLKAKFADTKDFIQWRNMFENLFSSVGQAISTLVEGVILGTQTMAQAFKKLAQAIITQFVNAVIQQALNPLVKAAAGVVAGLFSSKPGSSSSAGTGSSGDIDIGGPSMATQLQGAADSVGNFASGLSTATNATSVWTSATTAAQAGWSTFNASLATGESTFSALGSAWNAATGTFSAASGAISGLTVGLAGVGAAVAAFGTIMDFVNGKTEAAIGGVTGAAVGGVAGGVIGSYFGPGGTALGALMGAALGDALGSWLGGMFGGPSNYELKRIQAADEANKALGNLTLGFEAALKTFDSAQILGSLQAGGAGGSVRTELVLPAGLAKQIGLTGQQIGDQLVTQWTDVTLEQFAKVMDAFKAQPDLVQGIRGSGDVPLLPGGDAEAVAAQIASGAQALLTAFTAMEAVRDRIKTLASDLTDAAKDVLPAGAADAFAGKVGAVRDRMLAVLSSGLPAAEIQKQMDALEAELRNYTGLVDLYAQNTQLIAKLSADFVTQTRGAVLAIRTSLTAADRAVSNAQAAATRAMTPEAELRATTALRDAIVNRYQMELDMVNKLEASLAQIATKQGAVQQTLTTAAVVELGRGDATAFNEIALALADMAMVAPTTAQRLWAVGQGLAAVLAALPTTAKDLSGAEITSQVQSQAAPFFSALGDMIRAAGEAGDIQGQLGLLERQADLIKEVGSALVQTVNEWAAAASDAARTLAGEKMADVNKNWDAFAEASRGAAEALRIDVNKNWDAFADASHEAAAAAKEDIKKNWDAYKTAVTDAAEAAIKGEQDKIDAIELATKLRQKEIDVEIKGIEAATKAQQKSIAAQIDGLQVQRQALQAAKAAAQEWEGVAESLADFVQGLRLGSQSPINPADQLALAQSTFDQVNAAFTAGPTAAGAGDVQQAAADLLGASQNVLTRSSPEYQELFGAVVAAMEKVQGTAASMAPVSSGDIEAQTEILDASIEALRVQSQAIGEDAATRIDLLREDSAALNETAREQIEVLRGGIATIKDLLGAELTRIDAARQHDLDLVDAWLKVRDAEIKAGREYDLGVIDLWLKVRDQEIKDGRAYDLGVVKGWLDAQLAAIEASREGTVKGIQDGMIVALRENSAEQNRILGLLEGAQREALNEITKGLPLEQFKAKAAADTVSELVKLNGQIEQFLLGSGHAGGLAYVPHTGPYKLHQGERVLTREERLAYEGGMASAGATRAGGPAITYAPTVNVSGAGDPALIKAMVEEALRRDRRDFLRELETGAAGARLRG